MRAVSSFASGKLQQIYQTVDQDYRLNQEQQLNFDGYFSELVGQSIKSTGARLSQLLFSKL